jgi:hypothetical protein
VKNTAEPFRFSCAGEDSIAAKQTRAAKTNVSLMSLKEPNVAKTVKRFINPGHAKSAQRLDRRQATEMSSHWRLSALIFLAMNLVASADEEAPKLALPTDNTALLRGAGVLSGRRAQFQRGDFVPLAGWLIRLCAIRAELGAPSPTPGSTKGWIFDQCVAMRAGNRSMRFARSGKEKWSTRAGRPALQTTDVTSWSSITGAVSLL